MSSLPWEKEMATHSSTLAWKIPWTEEPGGLQSMGLLRVKHDLATSLSLLTFTHWRRKWQPTPVFLPGESQGRRSLVGSMGSHRVGHNWSDLAAAVYLDSWTEQKQKILRSGGKNKQRNCTNGSSWPRWSQWCDHSPRARHPGMWSQVGLRKHHYEQS